MVSWLTWKYGKTGFLYCGVEYYGDPKEMTAEGPSSQYPVGPDGTAFNGDGTLCYWGPHFAFYPSIRLNAIRDGEEDYEYPALLKGLADRAETAGKRPDLVTRARKLLAVDERVIRTTDGSPNFAYTLNEADILRARHDLAEAIVALEKVKR